MSDTKPMRCVQCDEQDVPGNTYCHQTSDNEHEFVTDQTEDE